MIAGLRHFFDHLVQNLLTSFRFSKRGSDFDDSLYNHTSKRQKVFNKQMSSDPKMTKLDCFECGILNFKSIECKSGDFSRHSLTAVRQARAHSILCHTYKV